MAEEQAVIVETPTESAATETLQESAPDQESAQAGDTEATKEAHRKRLGGWQRKLAKQQTELEYWKQVAQGKIAGGDPLTEDVPADEWARRRNEQLRQGIPYSENTRLLEEQRKADERIKREAREALEAEELAEQQRQQFQQLGPEQIEAVVQARLQQEKVAATFREWNSQVRELAAQQDPEQFQRLLANAAEIPLHPAAAEALIKSDPEVALRIANLDADGRAEFQRLSPAEQVAMVGWTAGKIAAEREAEGKKPKAPKPLSPITKPAASSNAPTEQDDADTWVKKRWAQVRAAGREI